MMQEIFDSLIRSGLVAAQEQPAIRDETVLLGAGSLLDSIAFVTFVTELEDRLTAERGEDVFLVLKDIHDFEPAAATLSCGTLARYVVEQTGVVDRG